MANDLNGNSVDPEIYTQYWRRSITPGLARMIEESTSTTNRRSGMKKFLARLILRRVGGVSKEKAGDLAEAGAGSTLAVLVQQWLRTEYGIEIPMEIVLSAVAWLWARALKLIGRRDAADAE